jgi:ABC-2 type transport system permease protein
MRADVLLYVIMMLMAIVLSYLFGNAMFGASASQRVCVVDCDRTASSAAFIADIGADSYTLIERTESEAEKEISKGDALAAIVIPGGFENALGSASAEVAIIRTAQSADIYALQSAVTAAVNRAAHRYALSEAMNEARRRAGLGPLTDEEIVAAYDARMGGNAAVRVIMVSGDDGEKEVTWDNVHYLIGFNLFFVMFSIVFTIGAILEDKKLHTWDRTRIAPVSGAAVLGGHFIPAFAVGVIQMLIVFGLGQMMFGIELGAAFWPVIAVFAVFSLTATCLGLLMAMAIRTYEQLSAITPVVLVATSMLGGCMWPLSIVRSDIMRAIACITPQKWAVEAAESLSIQGGGLGSVAGSIGVLAGMAVLFFAVSLLLYHKKRKA